MRKRTFYLLEIDSKYLINLSDGLASAEEQRPPKTNIESTLAGSLIMTWQLNVHTIKHSSKHVINPSIKPHVPWCYPVRENCVKMTSHKLPIQFLPLPTFAFLRAFHVRRAMSNIFYVFLDRDHQHVSSTSHGTRRDLSHRTFSLLLFSEQNPSV